MAFPFPFGIEVAVGVTLTFDLVDIVSIKRSTKQKVIDENK